MTLQELRKHDSDDFYYLSWNDLIIKLKKKMKTIVGCTPLWKSNQIANIQGSVFFQFGIVKMVFGVYWNIF